MDQHTSYVSTSYVCIISCIYLSSQLFIFRSCWPRVSRCPSTVETLGCWGGYWVILPVNQEKYWKLSTNCSQNPSVAICTPHIYSDWNLSCQVLNVLRGVVGAHGGFGPRLRKHQMGACEVTKKQSSYHVPVKHNGRERFLNPKLVILLTKPSNFLLQIILNHPDRQTQMKFCMHKSESDLDIL